MNLKVLFKIIIKKNILMNINLDHSFNIYFNLFTPIWPGHPIHIYRHPISPGLRYHQDNWNCWPVGPEADSDHLWFIQLTDKSNIIESLTKKSATQEGIMKKWLSHVLRTDQSINVCNIQLAFIKPTNSINKMGCFNDPAWKVCGINIWYYIL